MKHAVRSKSLFLSILVLLVAAASFSLAHLTKAQNPEAKPAAQASARSSKDKAKPCTSCPAPSPHRIYAPAISLPEASSSEIVLNSRSPKVIEVTPTLYTDEGTPIVGKAVQLQPAEIRFVKIEQLIPAKHRGRHKWGGIALSYTGGVLEVWAQIAFHGVNGGGSVDETFNILDEPGSDVREAVWWMPEKATAVIALGNSSDTSIHTTLQFSDGDYREVEIAPFATEFVRYRGDKKQRKNSPSGGSSESVKLQTVGPAGSLRPAGFIISGKQNFTSSIRFYDPRGAKQQHLFATNLRLKGTTSRLVLKNTSDATVSASPKFFPASGERGQPIELPTIDLDPQETAEVDLQPLTAALANRPDIDSASVEVVNSGAPGTLIGSLYNTNKATQLTSDVPLRDSGRARNSTGSYPWRVDGDYTTVVSITNMGDQPEKFIVDVRYPGGSYFLPARELAVGETAHFDLRQMLSEQKPDNKDVVLPKSVKGGQFHWSVFGGSGAGSPRLLGRSEVVSLSKKVSSSYSCPSCCPDSGPFGGINTPGTVPIDGFLPVGTNGEMTDCNGYTTNMGGIYMDSWWVENSSMCSVNPTTGTSTEVHGYSVGETYLNAEWGAFYWDPGPDDCYRHDSQQDDQQPMTVAPTVTFGSLDAVGKDQTASVQVTLNPSPSSVSVTLSLAATSGTGSAVFTSNNSSTLVVTQSTSVEIKGVTQSSTADNIRLEAKVNNQSLSTEDFTVILITLTLRTSGSVSLDNGGRSAYSTAIGTTSLGPLLSSGTDLNIRRYGVEIVGSVMPNNYTGSITLAREAVAFRLYNDMTQIGSGGPFSDTSDPTIRDDDPQSGGSSGKVYDLDAPGIGSTTSTPLNTISRRRTNFRQWATVGSNRVSADLQWFERISIIKTSSGDQLKNDLSGDNTVGTGTTLLTWNFQ